MSGGGRFGTYRDTPDPPAAGRIRRSRQQRPCGEVQCGEDQQGRQGKRARRRCEWGHGIGPERRYCGDAGAAAGQCRELGRSFGQPPLRSVPVTDPWRCWSTAREAITRSVSGVPFGPGAAQAVSRRAPRRFPPTRSGCVARPRGTLCTSLSSSMSSTRIASAAETESNFASSDNCILPRPVASHSKVTLATIATAIADDRRWDSSPGATPSG